MAEPEKVWGGLVVAAAGDWVGVVCACAEDGASAATMIAATQYSLAKIKLPQRALMLRVMLTSMLRACQSTLYFQDVDTTEQLNHSTVTLYALFDPL